MPDAGLVQLHRAVLGEDLHPWLAGSGKIWSVMTASPLPPKTSTDDQSTRIRSFTLPFFAFRGAVWTPGKVLLKSTAPEWVRSTYISCVVAS